MTTTETGISQPASDNLEIETLFRAAFERTKERLLSYILSFLFVYVLFFGALLAVGLLAGAHFLVWSTTQSVAAVGTLALISVVGVLTGFMYLGSWATLATTYTLISENKVGVMEAYKAMRPLVWGHVLVSFFVGLFIFGLVPISVFTLFILLLVWSVWGVFMIFVYMEKQEKGLANLWISQAIVNQRFWAILGRILLVYVAMWVLFFLLGMGAEDYPVLNIVSFIASLLLSPFVISYFYEMYKRLPHPKEIARPTVWIVLSIIGWVVMVFAIVSMSAAAAQSLPDVMQNLDKQMDLKSTGTI